MGANFPPLIFPEGVQDNKRPLKDCIEDQNYHGVLMYLVSL